MPPHSFLSLVLATSLAPFLAELLLIWVPETLYMIELCLYLPRDPFDPALRQVRLLWISPNLSCASCSTDQISVA